jgi:hypothetical protein
MVSLRIASNLVEVQTGCFQNASLDQFPFLDNIGLLNIKVEEAVFIDVLDYRLIYFGNLY